MMRCILNSVLALMSVCWATAHADTTKVEPCINARTTIERVLNDPEKRLTAWRTWAPNCARSGFYELVLAEYLIMAGRTAEAEKMLDYGLSLNSPYDDQLKAMRQKRVD